MAAELWRAITALEQASDWMLCTTVSDPAAALAGSFNFMMLLGYVCGGWQLARAAVIARSGRERLPADGFFHAKIVTASFYAEQILPKASALLTMVRAGSSYAQQLPAELF
jgi:acyl-CoA dehydrogenase